MENDILIAALMVLVIIVKVGRAVREEPRQRAKAPPPQAAPAPAPSAAVAGW
jgi:hypothetical protein